MEGSRYSRELEEFQGHSLLCIDGGTRDWNLEEPDFFSEVSCLSTVSPPIF